MELDLDSFWSADQKCGMEGVGLTGGIMNLGLFCSHEDGLLPVTHFGVCRVFDNDRRVGRLYGTHSGEGERG